MEGALRVTGGGTAGVAMGSCGTGSGVGWISATAGGTISGTGGRFVSTSVVFRVVVGRTEGAGVEQLAVTMRINAQSAAKPT